MKGDKTHSSHEEDWQGSIVYELLNRGSQDLRGEKVRQPEADVDSYSKKSAIATSLVALAKSTAPSLALEMFISGDS